MDIENVKAKANELIKDNENIGDEPIVSQIYNDLRKTLRNLFVIIVLLIMTLVGMVVYLTFPVPEETENIVINSEEDGIASYATDTNGDVSNDICKGG